VVCWYHLERSQSCTSIPAYARQWAMWMHHTRGPRFRSGTVDYDCDTLPNKSPATSRCPKLEREGGFRKDEEKAFINNFGSPPFFEIIIYIYFFEIIILNPWFWRFRMKEGYNLRILKSTQTFEIGCIPFWFLRLKSKVLIFGQTRSIPQKRFWKCFK
jgi:hypothetical protein